MMRGLSTRNYGAAVKDFQSAYKIEKSAVSENFIEASRETVKQSIERPRPSRTGRRLRPLGLARWAQNRTGDPRRAVHFPSTEKARGALPPMTGNRE